MNPKSFLAISIAMSSMFEPMKKSRGDNSNLGLPYFYFEHEGKKYEIQAVNKDSAKAKFEKIINRKK